jgi:arylsulfatase A-like enzyme
MKNLLFITADQWRAECLSVLGHKVQTPHLDALAADGTLFTSHFANAVPCGPSRASLHTGMYLQNHRSSTNGTPLDARHSNWAMELRASGLDPVLFGYTDTANDPREFDPNDEILRSYEGPLPGIRPVVQMGTYPDAWADWLAQRGHDIPDPTWGLYMEKKPVAEYEAGGAVAAPLALPAEEHDTRFMVDQVIDYVNGADDNWCVHLSLLRPHPPWIAPEPYNAMYPPGELADFLRADDVMAEGSQHPYLAHILAGRAAAPIDEKKLCRLKASYFGLMSEVDANLGRLFAWLKESGFWDNTLIVFTSDHGEQIGDHWLIGKMGYFDQSYRIPLIVRHPDAEKTRGKTQHLFTENIDIMPTILDWYEIPAPVQCDGQSLQPLLKTGSTPANWRTEAHWEYDFRDIAGGESLEAALSLTHHQCSLNVIRDHDYKYVHFTNLPPLFFDLKKDPGEFTNRATDPEYLPLVLEYAQKMLSWRMNHDEQTLTHLSLTDDGIVSRPSPRYSSS